MSSLLYWAAIVVGILGGSLAVGMFIGAFIAAGRGSDDDFDGWAV